MHCLRNGGRVAARLALAIATAVAPVAAFLTAAVLPSAPAAAQYQAPSERMTMTARSASTWTQDGEDVAQLEGPVKIELDRATLSARQAVVWLRPDPESRTGAKKAAIALIGDAKVEQPQAANAVRTGEQIVVMSDVSGRIQLRADDRLDRNASDSALYRAAQGMRVPAAQPAPPQPVPQPVPPPPVPVPVPVPVPPVPVPPPPVPSPPGPAPVVPGTIPGGPFTEPSPPRPGTVAPGPVAATEPTSPGGTPTTRPSAPVRFEAPDLETVDTAEGTVAVVLSRGVVLRQDRPNGDYIELTSDRAVLFTPLKSLRDLAKSGGTQKGEALITGAYLEQDVRVNYVAKKTPNNEQRLTAERVYYDFATDRAVLTDVVIRTFEPRANVPIIIRAKHVRQLAQGEYRADRVQLSSSQFAVPSFAIAADKAYVRQDTDDTGQDLYTYETTGTKFKAFDVPFFYWPGLSGTMTSDRTPLRAVGLEHSSAFGFGALTEWGLFESLGKAPPRDLDLTYRLDYYTDRGPAGGINARYKGGSVTETAREPYSFEGTFHSYFVYDRGFDDIGRALPRSHPDEQDEYTLRGEALYEHQHYFPDGWQLQLRAGYVTDPTFLEQWFPRSFDQELPHDVSAYVKRQKDNEAFSLLVQFQPNHLITLSEFYQEQFEVEHLPQIEYHRIGESLLPGTDGRDGVTLFSDNSVAGLHFQKTRASLAAQGFFPPNVSPGLPSLGQTGTTNELVVRGDFREELDFPFQAGQFKVVPYVVGRYTAYSDAPGGGSTNRLFGAAGVRASTAFWKVDDSVESDLFDLHRMRHVIEPELNLFTSAQTADRSDVFIYDEQVDPINDVSAVSLALRQRWQTYRGSPGRRRSVDFFTFDVTANFFSNQPRRDQLEPTGFRGIFFDTLPETSLARNSINFDASWRVSDNTVILADASENIEHGTRLATASVGLVSRRDELVTYYLGNRYIADLNSNITTAAIEYELSKKYVLSFAQSFDFSQNQNVASEFGFIRRFDAFLFIFKVYRNETTDQNGIGVNVLPYGVGYGLDTGQFESVLTRNR